MAETMNWIDYTLICIIGLSILLGFAKGFVKEIISLLSLVAAFFVASMFANKLAVVFTASPTVQNVVSQASSSIGMNAATPVSYVALGISFGVLFLGTIIAGSIVSMILNLAVQTGVLGLSNRLLGAGFGFLRGLLLDLVIIFVVQLTSFSQQPAWQQSQVVAQFQPAVVWLGNIVSPSLANLKERFGQTVQNVGASVQDLSEQYQGR